MLAKSALMKELIALRVENAALKDKYESVLNESVNWANKVNDCSQKITLLCDFVTSVQKEFACNKTIVEPSATYSGMMAATSNALQNIQAEKSSLAKEGLRKLQEARDIVRSVAAEMLRILQLSDGLEREGGY